MLKLWLPFTFILAILPNEFPRIILTLNSARGIDGSDLSLAEIGIETDNEKAISNPEVTIKLMNAINQRENSHKKLDSDIVWNPEYNYIVVGGGAAGCVVASRLAEDTSKTVLLIEAGGPQPDVSDIPALKTFLESSDYDWSYPIIPQKNGYLGYVNNQANVPRGKMFGGSGAMNWMNYYRENEHYFRLWTDTSGVTNWKWKDVLPFFLKSENNLDSALVAEDPEFHRTGGLITVITPKVDRILEEYLYVANMSGYPKTHSDGREPFGANVFQNTIKDGVRQTTSLAFLESREQPNLHTIGRSYVTKILFNDNKRAIGVHFWKQGIKFLVKVRDEIIVSAGSIESPKLLMNSGIGPEDHLKKLDIPVLSNLNVGLNLMSDTSLHLPFNIKDQSLVHKLKYDNDEFKEYYIDKKGPLTYTTSAITCFKEHAYPGYPGLSNGCIVSSVDQIGDNVDHLIAQHKYEDQWLEYYRPYLNRTYFKLDIELRRTKRRGSVRLASKNPFDMPLIDTCEMCEEQDLKDLLDILKKGLKIYQTPHMKKFIEPFKNPIPGCQPCPDLEFCEDYLRCIIKSYSIWICPTGSCSMGSDPAEGAVVDQYLRVYGVSGLRVVDASIIPVNTEQSYAMTVMVAEYGSELIKQNPIQSL